jgi:hypothetical protein
MVGDESE